MIKRTSRSFSFPNATFNTVTRAGRHCLVLCVALGLATTALAGCVYEPYPPPPPPGPIVAAPGYVQPCCYAYPEYPAYYGPAYYGPSVGVSIGGGGWGGHHWR